MKNIDVQELRAAIPELKDELTVAHELVVVSNGEPLATAALIREERDLR